MKAQYGTCRGNAPPSCCRKTVLSLKVPAGDFIVPLRSTNANLTIQKVQGACHQPHRSPQRAHQRKIRQQPRCGHQQEQVQFPSDRAAAKISCRGGAADQRSRLPYQVRQRSGSGSPDNCHTGVLSGKEKI